MGSQLNDRNDVDIAPALPSPGAFPEDATAHIDPLDYARALLNILEDLAEERDRLESSRAEVIESCEAIRGLNLELEDRVRRRTTQLEASNKELEAFAYSVSHDLRSPLRGIDGWSLALCEDFGSGLEPQAQLYLSRIRSEVQRMGHLIDDLLELSRIARVEMVRRHIDFTRIANTVADRLRESNPARRLEFVIQGGLTAVGDGRLLEIVLTNLLGNAVKFTAPRDVAKIAFETNSSDRELVYSVSDNGVGFDMRYADVLFGAFQRLHRQNDFPGSGVGLATVQRIIHRHGGRIWAASQPDRGATFSFTLGSEHEN